jgi:DNA-binding CsgD family transcriptional regulator
VKPGDAISLIEASYRVGATGEEWQERIAMLASEALGSKLGAMMFRYDVSSGDWVHPGVPTLHRLPPEFARSFFDQGDMPPESARAMAKIFMSVRFASSRAIFDRLGALPVMGPLFDRYGIGDLVGVNGVDPSGRGCMLTVAVNEMPRARGVGHVWHRIAAHLSAGNRLRATLEALANTRDDAVNRAEAVLAPTGKVEHAKGPAEARSAREALREALVRIDAARAEKEDATRSVDLWRGLVAGRWSLVEHFESDGRRYYLAHKNDPELAADRALTERERQVLGYAELGYSNKLIAYSLGLSSSTVATLLAKAKKKLGTATVRENSS